MYNGPGANRTEKGMSYPFIMKIMDLGAFYGD